MAIAVAQTLADGQEYRWTPELAPTGALTLIVSKLDRRMVAISNGVEIGRSVAEIDDDDPGSHVIAFVVRNGTPQWVYAGVTGHPEDEGKAVDEAVLNRVRIRRRFYKLEGRGPPRHHRARHQFARHPMIVDTPGAGLVLRQVRPDRRPSLVRQPE